MLAGQQGKGKPTHIGKRSQPSTTRSSNVFVVFDANEEEDAAAQEAAADSSFELITTELEGIDKNDTGIVDDTLAHEVFP